jgi:hypothetical protein
MSTVATPPGDSGAQPPPEEGSTVAGPAAESPPPEAAALPQVLKIVGAVVAPTTLLTALMYYFGRLDTAAFLWYFGTQITVLDLTVQDYLNSSVEGLIPPLIAVAGAALLTLWVHQLLLGALPAGTRQIVFRVLIPATAIAGLVLVNLAMADFLIGGVFPASFLEGRGLSLSIGVLLLVYAARLLRLLIAQRRPEQIPQRAPRAVAVAEWGAVFILVTVGLFWAVGSYAIGVGIGRAQQFEASLRSFSDVVMYSDKSLSMQAPGVREVTCQHPDAAYRFRYEGLKLVTQAGNQYLFLPSGWTHTNGAAILLPRRESLRLEFSPPGQVRATTC